MLTLILVGAIFALLCFWLWLVCPYKWQSFKFAAALDQIPGPKSLPILGNSLDFSVPPTEMMNVIGEGFKKYGPTFRIWMFGSPFVFTCDLNFTELMLKSHKELIKSDSYDFMQGLMGNTLGTSGGKLWQSQRKMLDPAFHSSNLRDYVNVFNTECEILVDKLTSLVDSEWVDVEKLISPCSLDILSDTVMGVKLGAQFERHQEFVTAIHRICEMITTRMFSPWLYRPLSFKLSFLGREEAKVLDGIQKFTRKVIQERRETLLNTSSMEEVNSDTSKKRPNLLDILLKHSDEKGIPSDEHVNYEVASVLFAGHDTVSAATCWALFMLGLHLEIQDRVVEELEVIFRDSDRQPDVSDLNNMQYLERVIKETSRLYPGGMLLGRKLLEDMKYDGITIPAGTNMNVVPYYVHRDKTYFPDPEKFDPDRFLPEKVKGRHPYCFIPFSMGPRNCIGQRYGMLEEKVMLSHILRKFRVTSLDKREDIGLLMALVLKPCPSLKMKFTLRKV